MDLEERAAPLWGVKVAFENAAGLPLLARDPAPRAGAVLGVFVCPAAVLRLTFTGEDTGGRRAVEEAFREGGRGENIGMEVDKWHKYVVQRWRAFFRQVTLVSLFEFLAMRGQ